MQPINEMFPIQDFKNWLQENQGQLSGLSIAEIADRARLAGYSRVVIAQWETQERFKRAA